MNARSAVLAVMALTVGAVTLISDFGPRSNSQGTLDPTAVGVQSSALYCAGLTNAANGEEGSVTFINTSSASRLIQLRVTGTGAQTTAKELVTVPAYGRAVVDPAKLSSGTTDGVTALVDGGGVQAVMSLATGQGESPCRTEPVTQWYASGLSTLVGNTAHLVLFNPSATVAVLNVTTYGAGGFGQPAPLQGVTVAPGSVTTINLGSSVVDAGAFGVGVSVLRGALIIAADELEQGVGSIDAGTTSAATHSRLVLVPTAEHAEAMVNFSNPGPVLSHVSIYVHLGSFAIPTQNIAVAPYSTATFVATPNTAIPAAGAASLIIRATAPVVTALDDGVGHSLVVSPAVPSWRQWVLSDVTGKGFDLAYVTNTSHQAVGITISRWPVGQTPAVVHATLPALTTVSLSTLIPGMTTLQGRTFMLTTNSNSLLVAATALTSPRNIAPLVALDGR